MTSRRLTRAPLIFFPLSPAPDPPALETIVSTTRGPSTSPPLPSPPAFSHSARLLSGLYHRSPWLGARSQRHPDQQLLPPSFRQASPPRRLPCDFTRELPVSSLAGKLASPLRWGEEKSKSRPSKMTEIVPCMFSRFLSSRCSSLLYPS